LTSAGVDDVHELLQRGGMSWHGSRFGDGMPSTAPAARRPPEHAALSAASLREQHVVCERLFQDLVNRAESSDWHACDEIWDRFSSVLEEHMSYEEARLFPQLAASGDAERLISQRLREDHAAFRHALAEMGVAIEIHSVRLTGVEDLVGRLRAHAALEDRCLYPFADERSR
jgi:hemerythrin-like domain-containing protein